MSKKLSQSLLLTVVLLFVPKVFSQTYNFNFYNGQTDTPVQIPFNPEQKAKELTAQKPPVVPPLAAQAPVVQAKQEESSTGLLLGYSQSEFLFPMETYANMSVNTVRLGLTFQKSRSFNVDLEYLHNKVSLLDLYNFYGLEHEGTIPGLSLGMRGHYWLNDSVALTLGGNIRGMKGSVSGEYDDQYKIQSYGAALSVGPTFKFGGFMISGAYERGKDKVEVAQQSGYGLGSDDEYSSFGTSGPSRDEWLDNSTIKVLVSYKF